MRLLLLTLVLSIPLAAQWLNLPTPGVPRNADGSPNLTAPAPKTADGKPDFSGMWVPRAERRCVQGPRMAVVAVVEASRYLTR